MRRDDARGKPRRNICHVGLVAGLVATTASLGACKIVTIEEDRLARQQQSDQFDSKAYTQAIWTSKVLPFAQKQARPLPQLLQALKGNFETAAKAQGRQPSDGSPWTFLIQGEGTVTRIDNSSRAGVVEVSIDTPAGKEVVLLQSGPVVTGTSIRDALPFISFNNFSNQIAFADEGNALTMQAGRATLPKLAQLKAGASVSFVGACTLRSATDPVRITVISVGVA